MCGIAGIFSAREGLFLRPRADRAIEKMLCAITHRGPDGAGIFLSDMAGIGHCRLSIIDLAGGAQPMSNEDDSIWITFNGEIFNYIELRQDLVKKGHVFKTNSDTEVIIHLYEDYGEACVNHLNGQFAFAIFDAKKAGLFMARDRLGIRPLFYAEHGGFFYFASEVKALFASGDISREIDPDAIDEVFTLWGTVAPRTSFKRVSELLPGHFMVVKRNGAIDVRRYWDVDFSGRVESNLGIEDSAERLKELLVDSTRLQLRSDVPVGAYLSGGLDSSVTTALIRNFSSSRLETFSVAFEDAAFDESGFQAEVSRALGTVHHEIRCRYSDISDVFPRVVWHAEKPVVRTAPAPLLMLSGLVRSSDFKVVLTGEGADEVLGGYDIFRETKIREFWSREPQSKTRPLLLKRLYPYLPQFQKSPGAYTAAFFGKAVASVEDVFFSHRPRWDTSGRNRVFFSDALADSIKGSAPERGFSKTLPDGFASWSPLHRAEYLEMKGLLPGYILSSQGDRVSMANSIEGRFPFLDHRVVEFCASMPDRHKINVLNEKYALKKAFAKDLPQSITKRTKQPYLAPDAMSFFNSGRTPDYVDELMSERVLRDYGYFNPERVGLLVEKLRRSGAGGFRDNMAFVGILSTQLLHRLFVEDFKPGNQGMKNVSLIRFNAEKQSA